MPTLIIGAGYVGKEIVLQDSITYCTTSHEKKCLLESEGKQALVLDIGVPGLLEKHLAAYDTLILCLAPKRGASYAATYLKAARELSSALQAPRKKPLYVLYTSSTSVYGDREGKEVDESVALVPTSDNCKVLQETELGILHEAKDTVQVCVLRLGGIWGPGRSFEERAKMMAESGALYNGSAPTNHIHRDDIVRAISFCVEHKLQGVYNLVADDHPTRKNLYSALFATLGLLPPIFHEEASTSPHRRMTSCCVSNAKIKAQGFQFLHPHLPFTLP